MFTHKKIGIVVIIFAVFVMGGVAFNAYQAGAFGTGDGGYKYGFFKGGFEDLDKDSPEWQAKIEEIKAKKAEWKAEKLENGEHNKDGFGKGHNSDFLKFSDEVNHEVVNLENGVQVTITSDNPDIVQKLQDMASKHSSE